MSKPSKVPSKKIFFCFIIQFSPGLQGPRYDRRYNWWRHRPNCQLPLRLMMMQFIAHVLRTLTSLKNRLSSLYFSFSVIGNVFLPFHIYSSCTKINSNLSYVIFVIVTNLRLVHEDEVVEKHITGHLCIQNCIIFNLRFLLFSW